MIGPRERPCAWCPYRLGVPSGIWAPGEYEHLPGYDGTTAQQAEAGAVALFFCHEQTGQLCAGWTGCHDMDHNLAIRMSREPLDFKAIYAYVSPVPLFTSGAEACAHGLRELETPGPDAARAAEGIIRKRSKNRKQTGEQS